MTFVINIENTLDLIKKHNMEYYVLRLKKEGKSLEQLRFKCLDILNFEELVELLMKKGEL